MGSILWLDFEEMETFERAYASWMELKKNPKATKIEVDVTAQSVIPENQYKPLIPSNLPPSYPPD